ncbi:MAG: GNAT family N-acetyltransferase [Actinoplanes sp.]
MKDLILRPITGREELDLFQTFLYVLNDEVADDLEAGRRRPQWLWVALRGDQVVARAGWWSKPGDKQPLVMDILDFDDDAEAAGQLVRTALATLSVSPPEYNRYIASDWRDHDDTRRAVEQRMAVLEGLGAKLFVERLRLEWLPGTPIAGPTGRLVLRPLQDAEELIAAMTLVMAGTLDAHGRHDLTTMTAREAAEQQYREELDRYTSPHEWWRMATLPDGTPVGFVIPAHNGYNPIIAYLGVLPAQRGHGHIDEILAAGTRILADEGMPRVRAATDLDNVPMARAFARAGYVNFERQIDMTWH